MCSTVLDLTGNSHKMVSQFSADTHCVFFQWIKSGLKYKRDHCKRMIRITSLLPHLTFECFDKMGMFDIILDLPWIRVLPIIDQPTALIRLHETSLILPEMILYRVHLHCNWQFGSRDIQLVFKRFDLTTNMGITVKKIWWINYAQLFGGCPSEYDIASHSVEDT